MIRVLALLSLFLFVGCDTSNNDDVLLFSDINGTWAVTNNEGLERWYNIEDQGENVNFSHCAGSIGREDVHNYTRKKNILIPDNDFEGPSYELISNSEIQLSNPNDLDYSINKISNDEEFNFGIINLTVENNYSFMGISRFCALYSYSYGLNININIEGSKLDRLQLQFPDNSILGGHNIGLDGVTLAIWIEDEWYYIPDEGSITCQYDDLDNFMCSFSASGSLIGEVSGDIYIYQQYITEFLKI